jgi:hypothetical protein
MTTPRSAQEAYNKVAKFLHQKSKANGHLTSIDDPEDALEAYGQEIELLVGVYAPAVDMMIRVYYNIEDFVADGEPMDQVWRDIEELAD